MLRVHKRVGMPPEYVPSASALFALDAQRAGKCARKTLAQSSASTSDVHDDAAGSDDHDDDDGDDDEHSAVGGSAAAVAIVSSKRRNASVVAEEAAEAAAIAANGADAGADASASATLSTISTFKRMRLGDASEETKSALEGTTTADGTDVQQHKTNTDARLFDNLALPAPLRRRAERARKHAEQGRRAVLSYTDVEQLVQAAFDAGDAAGRQASQRTFEQQLLDMQRAFSKLADDYQTQAFGHLPPGGSGSSDARGSCSYIA